MCKMFHKCVVCDVVLRTLTEGEFDCSFYYKLRGKHIEIEVLDEEYPLSKCYNCQLLEPVPK
jgi:hypothetical protein